jgi:hypothetical protein
MPTPHLLTAHRAWQGREGIETDPPLPCEKCGCLGNLECGHEPLGLPDHGCELDINSDGERGWCWCCRIEEEERKKMEEPTR